MKHKDGVFIFERLNDVSERNNKGSGSKVEVIATPLTQINAQSNFNQDDIDLFHESFKEVSQAVNTVMASSFSK